MNRLYALRNAFYVLVAIAMVSGSSKHATAQAVGNNAVYNSSGITYSTAYIDANAIAGTSSATDICAKINAALNLIPSGSTAVIDARGVSNLACPTTGTHTPWSYGGTVYTPSSTILLPAGTITTSSAWTLPNGTRLVGEGSGSVISSLTAVTTIQSSASTIINMGAGSTTYCPLVNSAYVCTGVSVEDLVINGNGTGGSTAGIYNNNAQEQSYVKRVAFYQVSGIGLKIVSGGANSGPYTDITFGNSAAGTLTSCVAINGVSTRGIHGLTCSNTGSVPASGAGVLLGGSNNSVEDVTVAGFHDGVVIGANAIVQGAVVVNVVNSTPSVGNAVVHISSTNTVSDVTVMGVNKGAATYSIEDDITAGTPLLQDTSVGIYAVGESVATKTYSRFTTSPSLPAWVQSNSAAPSTQCVIGSLYSNTAGTNSNNDWYVCTPKNSHSCTSGPCWTYIK